MPGGVSECNNRESIYLKHLVFMVGRGGGYLCIPK